MTRATAEKRSQQISQGCGVGVSAIGGSLSILMTVQSSFSSSTLTIDHESGKTEMIRPDQNSVSVGREDLPGQNT